MRLKFWKVILVVALSAGPLFVLAQKKKPAKPATDDKPTVEQTQPAAGADSPTAEATQIDPVLEHYYKKYAMASRWSDDQVAKSALYDMIIRRPENDSLIFTLGYFYFENRQYASAMLVSQELLARDGKNLAYLELSAASFEALGILDRALQNYETLFLISNNTMALYKIAFLQYDLKRFEEGLTNVDILLGKPDVETVKIGFNDTKNQPKDFLMKYAVRNLKGMILEAKGDKAGARKIYQEIVKEVPDFEPAVTNLAGLDKG